MLAKRDSVQQEVGYIGGCHLLADLIFSGSRGYLNCKSQKSDIQIILVHFFWRRHLISKEVI